jgi:predicted transcriptional regulator of viral defense system
MNNSERFKILMESGRTVFTPLDLRMLWWVNALNAKISVVRMVEKGLMVRLATGYYTLNDRYNRYELANRILSPSYVSFQSALFYAGINFQARGEVGSVALRVHRKKVGNTLYTYVAMKRDLFFNTEGVVTREGVAMALPERAILDSFYYGYLPDIDDTSKLNKTFLEKLSALYPKTVQKKMRGLL